MVKLTRKRPVAATKRRRKALIKRKPAASKTESRGIRKSLFFGRRRQPTSIIVLFHGLNDSAQSCAEGVVGPWAKGLPDALLAVPQSPDRTSWSTHDDPGYTWFQAQGLFPFDAMRRFGKNSHEFEASINEFHQALLARCEQVEVWLDALLAKHRLSDRELVLAGFSQGSILAALIGARRNLRGVIVCGGVPFAGFFRLAELMPKRTQARFCAVNGTKDEVVERRPLEAMLGNYTCEWHWSKGVGHDSPDEWYRIELAWLQRLFTE